MVGLGPGLGLGLGLGPGLTCTSRSSNCPRKSASADGPASTSSALGPYRRASSAARSSLRPCWGSTPKCVRHSVALRECGSRSYDESAAGSAGLATAPPPRSKARRRSCGRKAGRGAAESAGEATAHATAASTSAARISLELARGRQAADMSSQHTLYSLSVMREYKVCSLHLHPADLRAALARPLGWRPSLSPRADQARCSLRRACST